MISRIEEVPVSVRSMTYDDLPNISDIERRSYDFPWSLGHRLSFIGRKE